jgi:hypothetical protein
LKKPWPTWRNGFRQNFMLRGFDMEKLSNLRYWGKQAFTALFAG